MILACVRILPILFSCTGESDSRYNASVDGSEGRRVLEAGWIRSSRAIEPAEIDESDIDIPRPETPGFWEPWREGLAAPAGSVRRWLFTTEVQAPPGAERLALETEWKTRLFQGDSLRIYLNGFLAGRIQGKSDSVIMLDGAWLNRGSSNDLLLVAVSPRIGTKIELPRVVSLPDTSLRRMKLASFGEFSFTYTDGASTTRLLKLPRQLQFQTPAIGSAEIGNFRTGETRWPRNPRYEFEHGDFAWTSISDVYWYLGWHRHRRIFRSIPGSAMEIHLENYQVPGNRSWARINGVLPVKRSAGFLRPGSDTAEVGVYWETVREKVCSLIDSTDPSHITTALITETAETKTLLNWHSAPRNSQGWFLGMKHGSNVSWHLRDDTLKGDLHATFEPPPSMDAQPPVRWWERTGILRFHATTLFPVLAGPPIDSALAAAWDDYPNRVWYGIGDFGKVEIDSLKLDKNAIRASVLDFAPFSSPTFEGFGDTTRPWVLRFDTLDFAWNPHSKRDSMIRCNLRMELLKDLPLFGNLWMRQGSVVSVSPKLGSWAIHFEGAVAIPDDPASSLPVAFSLDSSDSPVEPEFRPWKGRLRVGGFEIQSGPEGNAQVGGRFRSKVFRDGKRVSPKTIHIDFRGAQIKEDGKPDAFRRIRSLSIDEDRNWSIVILEGDGKRIAKGRFARPQDSN